MESRFPDLTWIPLHSSSEGQCHSFFRLREICAASGGRPPLLYSQGSERGWRKARGIDLLLNNSGGELTLRVNRAYGLLQTVAAHRDGNRQLARSLGNGDYVHLLT